jgi:hypothetical protein
MADAKTEEAGRLLLPPSKGDQRLKLAQCCIRRDLSISTQREVWCNPVGVKNPDLTGGRG